LVRRIEEASRTCSAARSYYVLIAESSARSSCHDSALCTIMIDDDRKQLQMFNLSGSETVV
jgi:hypothetical protein